MCKNDTDPDFFSIFGRPCLLCSDVQDWFAELDLARPTIEDVAPIAKMINRADIFRCLWKDGPSYKHSRSQNSSVKRLGRIAKALETLEHEIPEALEVTKRGHAGDFVEFKRPYDDLLVAVKKCMPQFEAFLSRPRGRSRAGWHSVARQLGPLFKEASEAAGNSRLGFGKPTSVGIPLIKRALLRLGVDAKDETIVEAMRSPRQRQRRKNGESKNDIPQAPRSI